LRNEIIEPLTQFLQSSISAESYDVVITIERTGHRLFHLCLINGLKINGIRVIPSKAVVETDVKNKHVMLFDDKSSTGKHISETKKHLEGYGAKKVDAVVYAVTKTSNEVDKFCIKLSKTEENSYRESISILMESLPYPYFTDTIFIEALLNKNLTKDGLLDSIKGLGKNSTEVRFRNPGSVTNLVKITLNDPPVMLQNKNSQDYTLKQDIWKIRFFLLNEKHITIVPYALPIVIPKTENPGIHMNFPYCLCAKHAKNSIIQKKRNPKWSLCNYCIVFNYSTDMLRLFLENWEIKLKAMGFKFHITSIVNEYAENIFNDSDMGNYLNNLFSKYYK
jgi:hypothetical protein